MLRRTSPQSVASWLPALFGLLAIGLGTSAGALVMGFASPLRLFLVILALTTFLATVARIEWGLLVLVFIVYTRFSDILIHFHGAPSFAKSFILVLVLAILVRWGLYGERPTGWVWTAILVAAFGLVGSASLLYAADVEKAQEAASDFLKDGAVTVVVAILLQRGVVLRRVAWTLLIVGIFLGTLSVIQFATGSFDSNFGGFAQAPTLNIVGETDHPRASGPIGDPNFYAQVMLVIIPLALDRFWNERRLSLRLVAIWALAVTALAIVFSYSRGGFVALVVMVAGVMLYNRYRPVYWLGMLALGIALLQFVPSIYTDRLRTLVDVLPSVGGNDVRFTGTFRGRTSEVLVAWEMFADHPVIGVGLGNYPAYYQDYSRRIGLDQRTEERTAHNLYLEIAAETGLLGLSVFGLILLVMFRGLWRARKTFADHGMQDFSELTTAFMFGLVGYLAASMFIHGAYPRYFWLLAGIAFAIPHIARTEAAAQYAAPHATAEA